MCFSVAFQNVVRQFMQAARNLLESSSECVNLATVFFLFRIPTTRKAHMKVSKALFKVQSECCSASVLCGGFNEGNYRRGMKTTMLEKT
jgi:hypothetical protein